MHTASDEHTFRAFRPSLELDHTNPAERIGDSHEALIPFSASTIGVRFTQVYLTWHVPLAGFLNLLGGYSSERLEALFRASNAHRVSLSRGFPSTAASQPRRLRLPS